MTTLHEAAKLAVLPLESAKLLAREEGQDHLVDDINAAIEALRSALAQQGEQPNNAEVICPSCCHQFRAIPEDVQRLMLDAGFEPPFTAAPQQEPNWDDSETSINELWKNPAYSMADRLRMADGAVAFRDKTIKNLRNQIDQLKQTS